MANEVTFDHLKLLRDQPHLLGLLCGYKDLTPLHSEWIKYIWTSGRSVALNAHRGSFKSTSIKTVGSVWYMLFNPNDRIFIVQKTYADAADAVATIAKVMEIPEIREIFKFAHGEYPEFTVRREGKLEFSFKKTKTGEGNITGFGLSSPFTGRHCDFLLADDISTLKDRLSKAEREFTKMIWRELAANIIDRGKPCCYIGTPWHRDGVESIIPKPLKFSINECNLITPEQLERIRAETTPALFAANYLLEFTSDDEALFKDPNWGEWEYANTETPIAHIDAAYGGDDYCALTIGARRVVSRKIQAVGFTYHGNVKDWIPTVDEILRRYKVKKVFCEKQSDRGYTASLLRHQGFSVHEYDESLNKQHKIGSYLYESWRDIIWSNETDDVYMSQIVDWTPKTKEHDDAPDSAACLMRARFSKKGSNLERWKW